MFLSYNEDVVLTGGGGDLGRPYTLFFVSLTSFL